MNINSTLILQWIVFAILVGVTMKFVWPPIVKALDERILKVKNSLEAADRAKRDAAAMEDGLKKEQHAANAENAQRIADAERQAKAIIEAAKTRASEEAEKIVTAARADAEAQVVKAREDLRGQVAELAIRGAEQVLQREVNPQAHAELLARLQAQL